MKKRVRIYKAGGTTGQYINRTAQFLQKAENGMEIRSEESDMNMHDRVLVFIQKSLQEGQLNRDEIAKTILDQNLGYEEEIVNKMIDDVAMSLQQQMMPEEEMETDEMQENYSRLGGQKKPSRKKFIKDYLKKAQEGLEQQVSSTNDTPLDGRETFKNNFIKGIQESVLKDQANKQFDLQNNMFVEGGDSNEDISVPPVGAENGWAHSMHDYGEALAHMMPENTLTTAKRGRQVSRDMRRINRDFQKMFGNIPVGYNYPGSILPSGISVINPLMSSAAFNVPDDKTTGNEKGELINLPNMKVRAKRGWLGRLKEWEADINFGAIPANMMYGIQTGYPFQTFNYGQSYSPGVITTRKVSKIINNESIKEVANKTNSEAANNASMSPAEKARQDAEKARQEKLAEQSKDWMYFGANDFRDIGVSPTLRNNEAATKAYVEARKYQFQGNPFDDEGYTLNDENSPFVKQSGIVDNPNTLVRENLVYSGPLSQNELNAKHAILSKKLEEYESMEEGPAKDKAWKEYRNLEKELGSPYEQDSYITTDDEGNEYSTLLSNIQDPNPKAKELWNDLDTLPGWHNYDWVKDNRDLLFRQKGGAKVSSPMASYYPTSNAQNKIASNKVKAKSSDIKKSKSCGKGLVYDFEKGKCVPEKQVKGEEEIFYTETIPQSINNNNIYNQPNQFTMGPQSAGTGDAFWQAAVLGPGIAKGVYNAAAPVVGEIAQAATGAFNSSLPLGSAVTNATSGALTPSNLLTGYIKASSIKNLIDPNSDTWNAVSNAYNNPTLDNIVNAGISGGIDIAGAGLLPSEAKYTLKGTKYGNKAYKAAKPLITKGSVLANQFYNNYLRQDGGEGKKAKAIPMYMKASADYQELLDQLKSEQDQTGYGTPRWAELERLIPYYEDSLYNAQMKEMVPEQIKDQQAGKSAYQRFAGKNLDPAGSLKGALSNYRDHLKMVRNMPNDNLYMYGNPYYLEDAGYYLLEGADWLNENLHKVGDYFGWPTFGFESGGQINQQDPNYGDPNLYKFVYGGIDPDGYPMVKDVNDPYFRNGGLFKYAGPDQSQVTPGTTGNDYGTWAKSRAEQAALDEYNAYMNRTNTDASKNVKYNANPNDAIYQQILAKHTGASQNQNQTRTQTQNNVTSGQGFQPGQFFPGNPGGFDRPVYGGYGRPNYGREIAGSILGVPLGMLGARRNKLFTPDFNYWTQTGVPTVGGMPYYGQLDPTKISNIHTESKGRGLFRRPSTTMDINFNVPAGSTRPKLYTDASGNIKNANPMFSPNVGTTDKKEMSPMESVIKRETEGMSGKDLKTRTRDIKRAFKKGYGSDYMEDDSRNSTTYTQGTPPANSNNVSGYTPNASGPGNSGYNADSDGNGIPDYLEVKNESETPQSSVNWQQSLPNTNYLEQAKNNPFAGNPDLQRFTEEQAAPNQLNIQSGTPGFDLPASRQAPPAEFNISEGDAFEQRQLDKGLVWNEDRRKWVPNEENMNVINQAIDMMDPSYRSSQSDTRYIGGLPDDFNQVNQEVIPTNQESTPFSFPNQNYLESGIQIPNEAGMNSTDQIPYMEEQVGPVAPDYFSPEANEGFDPYFINSPVNRQQRSNISRRMNQQQRSNISRSSNNSSQNWNINSYKPKYNFNYTPGTSEEEMKKEDYNMNVSNKQNQIITWRENQLKKLNSQGLSEKEKDNKRKEIMSLSQQMFNKVDEDYRTRWQGVRKLGGLAKFQGPQNSQVQTGFSKQTGMKCPMGAVKDPVTGFCKDISTGQMVQPISSLSVPSVDELTKNPFTNTASDPYKNPLTGESAAITNTNDGYKYTGEDLVDMGLPDDVAKARFKMNTAGTLNTYDLASNIFNLGMPMASNLLTTARNQRMEDTYEGRQLGRTTHRDKRGGRSDLTGRDALRPQEEGEIIVGQNAKYGGSRYKQGSVYNMSKQELMAFMAAGGQIEFL